MIVGLADLKLHLRADGNFDNALIEAIGAAAEEEVREWIGRPVYETDAEMPAAGAPGYHPHQMHATPAIRVAVLMMAERIYRNRGGEGADAEAAVPPMSVRALLAGLRVFATLPADRPDLGDL